MAIINNESMTPKAKLLGVCQLEAMKEPVFVTMLVANEGAQNDASNEVPRAPAGSLANVRVTSISVFFGNPRVLGRNTALRVGSSARGAHASAVIASAACTAAGQAKRGEKYAKSGATAPRP